MLYARTYRGGVAFDTDGNPSLLGLLLEHLVVGSVDPGAGALARFGSRRARGGRQLLAWLGGVVRAAVGAEVHKGRRRRAGGLPVIAVRGATAAQPERQLIVGVGLGAGRRRRQ